MTVDWEKVAKERSVLLTKEDICEILDISQIQFYEEIARQLSPIYKYNNEYPLFRIEEVKKISEQEGLSEPYLAYVPQTDEKQEQNPDEDKQANRFELRKRIYEIMKSRLGKKYAIEQIDEPFDWIYNSPMNEWKNMLYCFEQECYIDSKDNKWSDNATRDARSLYELLK